MNEMVEAAVEVTSEAVSLAEELLERWYDSEAEKAKGDYYEMKKLKRQYEDYKNRLFKVY